MFKGLLDKADIAALTVVLVGECVTQHVRVHSLLDS